MKKNNRKRMDVSGFRAIRHTADLGFEIWAQTLNSLFENAAGALYASVTNRSKIRAEIEKECALRAGDLPELMVAWINELLFFLETDRFLAKSTRVQVDPAAFELRAVLVGEIFDRSRHTIKLVPKAATFHRLRVEYDRARELWVAGIVVDV